MFNPVFRPNIASTYESSLRTFTESIMGHIVPTEIKVGAYRVGTGCFHVLYINDAKLDTQLEITITDGGVDIPDKTNCLDSLRVGHIQIGVLDSMDVVYMLNHLLNALSAKNEHLNISNI